MSAGFDGDQTRVGLAGDWECNAAWAREALDRFADHGVRAVFHLGDLSVWPGPRGRQFLSELEGGCRRYGITVYLTPGNHEDHPRLNALPRDVHGLGWVSDHLAVLPRGHRWTLAGKTFVSLGGAPSVDFPSRTEGKTWFPEEVVTDADVDAVAAGGHADMMLAHDAPAPATPAVDRIVASGRGWTRRGLDYATAGRERMTKAFQAVRPLLYAHGHYHVRDEAVLEPDGWDHPCQMLSLDCADHPGNLVLLDLADPNRLDETGIPGIGHAWL